MDTTLRTLTRSLRTDIHTRVFPNCARLSRFSPASHLNQCRLYPPLNTSPRPFRTNGMLSCRTLSTRAQPPPKSHRARVVSARELYAQRNRSLFMYTSAVVRASSFFPPPARPRVPPVPESNRTPTPTRSETHWPVASSAHIDRPCRRRILCRRTTLSHVLRRDRFRRHPRRRHGPL